MNWAKILELIVKKASRDVLVRQQIKKLTKTGSRYIERYSKKLKIGKQVKGRMIRLITQTQQLVTEPRLKEQINWYKKLINQALTKAGMGKRLSTTLIKAIKSFEDSFISDDKNDNIIYTNDSRWILWAQYNPLIKTVTLKLKRSSKSYIFFLVPKTKWLRFLTEPSPGEYMWNWFGKHYSINPQRWVRRYT